MNDLRIGIITLFDMKNVNYGNRLQAYALNYYLNHHTDCECAETLYFDGFKDFKRTKAEPLFNRVMRKLDRVILHRGDNKLPPLLKERLTGFNDFSARNIKLVCKPLSRAELASQTYDAFIVGSDVVWYQWDNGIRPVKLLDFSTAKPFKKISYAASFGNDRIPEENRTELIRCFRSFDSISVREKSSLEVMHALGRDDAVHVMDPTLLLSEKEWANVERCVPELENRKYIFVYLLSTSSEDRIQIERISKATGLPIVTVPYASGTMNHVDKSFGDYPLINCSPEEWVWLIHHAEYVITDSFHGCAFSANLKTPFLVTKRKEKFEMNNRMLDFLDTLGQKDKYVDLSTVESPGEYIWDFDSISSILENKAKASRDYLNTALKKAKYKGPDGHIERFCP